MSNNFKMSTIPKPEKDLCRCCHSEGSFKNLYTKYSWLNTEEVIYSTVIRECFNIELLKLSDSSLDMLCAICYDCIQRLEDAMQFRKQIQEYEKRFRNVYDGCFIKKGTDAETAVKDEKPELEESIFKLSTGNSAIDDRADDASIPDDDNFENVHSNDPSEEFEMDTAVKDESSGNGRETRKRGKLKVIRSRDPAQTGKKKVGKKKAGKKAQSGKIELMETIEVGVIKRNFTLIRDVDYKKTENGFECLKCSKCAVSRPCFRLHYKKVHLKIPKHKCPDCFKTFLTEATYTKHKFEEHNIDDRFKCNACDSAFNTRVQLKKHINTYHMLGVKIKCEECDYETFSMESLYKHKFKHKTVKDFQCKFCRKAFLRKTTMQLHERIHTGDRRKVCAVCGQAFVQKASLNYHMTKYHPEVAF